MKDTSDRRYRVFVGSAAEDLETVNAIVRLLDRRCEVKPWTNMGEPGNFFLSTLISKVRDADFAILVVDAVDVTTSRHHEKAAPRDNVIFELGLCQGLLAMERCFMVHDRKTKPDLPSDLLGLTPAEYERHSDGNQVDALRSPVGEILDKMDALGPRPQTAGIRNRSRPGIHDSPCVIVDCWSGLALDSKQEPLDNDARPCLWTLHGAPWQQWRLKPVSGSLVAIESVHCGLVLTTDRPAGDRSWVWLDEYRGETQQHWRLGPTADGFAFRIETADSAHSLDAHRNPRIPATGKDHGISDPTSPHMWTSHSGKCQKWTISLCPSLSHD